MSNPIDFWKFNEEFTVVQATLLILGIDPAGEQERVLQNTADFRPTGFDAIFSGITLAIKNKKLNAIIRYPAWEQGCGENPSDDEKIEVLAKLKIHSHDSYNGINDNEITTAYIIYKITPDWTLTTVNAEDLKQWLLSKNFKPAFFFDNGGKGEPDYMNPNHERYSPKLAATVKVWLAMEDNNLLEGKAVKDALSSWLENNYHDLGLVYNNKINKQGIEECAKVANWNPDGGATKTPVKSTQPTT